MADDTSADVTSTVTTAGPTTPSGQEGWTTTEADITTTVTTALVDLPTGDPAP